MFRSLPLVLILSVIAVACESGSTTPDPTVTVQSELLCPVSDVSFCEFADDLDTALGAGDIDFFLDNSRVSSETCSFEAEVGPCVGLPRNTVLEGYEVAIDSTEFSRHLSEREYRTYLETAARVDTSATDEFGDGTWRIAAILDHSILDVSFATKAIITTSIGPDPIRDSATSERRVFFWGASFGPDGWGLDVFLTTSLVRENLTGIDFDESPIESWLPWGGT